MKGNHVFTFGTSNQLFHIDINCACSLPLEMEDMQIVQQQSEDQNVDKVEKKTLLQLNKEINPFDHRVNTVSFPSF